MTEVELIAWAIKEIRELDELCRSLIPGYASLDSEDMERLRDLKDIERNLTERLHKEEIANASRTT
jgi:hypothetical protein